MEMAENLRHRGIGVTIIEVQDQVFAPFDSEMAEALHGEIRRAGVELILSDAVESFKNGSAPRGSRISPVEKPWEW